jgi:ADP-L-glycero-D-manno-heptose 6-epimerase
VIVVTGGAGFIGSALVWGLNQKGEDDIFIVDHLSESENWKNLISLRYNDYLDKEQFIVKLENNDFGDSIDAILHMGACSSTTEKDAYYLIENNYRYTARIAAWHEGHRKCRFIYASSAATYGNGDQGYSDNEDDLGNLRPLNMYGYSKHMFDLLAKRKGWFSDIVGLKYFNVFGPNENHKGDMRSVINKAYPGVRDKGTISLFKSYREDYKDGEQCRDFIYIKDAVEMTLFFLDKLDVNGLFNVGTGRVHSWNDVAKSMFNAVGKKVTIEYIPMLKDLKDKYQYYTCADMQKLRSAGCSHTCMGLEEAIKDYICMYLFKGAFLGMK